MKKSYEEVLAQVERDAKVEDFLKGCVAVLSVGFVIWCLVRPIIHGEPLIYTGSSESSHWTSYCSEYPSRCYGHR